MSDVVYDVAIVGGGLAGINAGVTAWEEGLSTILVESSDEFGGKLRSDRDDEGFTYDRGFQVNFSSYDEIPVYAQGLLGDLAESFSPGAKIVGCGELNQWDPLKSMFCKAVSLPDLLTLLKLNLFAKKWQSFQTRQTAREFLVEFGFSPNCIAKFFTPFLGGIFLDRSLSFSARQFLKTWFFLSQGSTVTFSEGIQCLPGALLSEFALDPSNIETVFHKCLNSRVTRIVPSEGGFDVSTNSEMIRARSVVIATDSSAAGQLLDQQFKADYKSSICLFFSSDKQITSGRSIVLNPTSTALINQLVPLSNVNPACAPKGKHLCSATIIGERPESDEELAALAINEMKTWGMNLPPLEFKRAYRIKEAQLLQDPGFEDNVPSIETHLSGVFLAGEMTTSSSINDALKSGRLAAEAALAYLKNK